MKRLHHSAKAGFRSCPNGTAREVTPGLDCGLDCDSSAAARPGTQGLDKDRESTGLVDIEARETDHTAPDAAPGCRSAGWAPLAQSGHVQAHADGIGPVHAATGSCLATWSWRGWTPSRAGALQ
jgi:hypothetical protein